MFEFEEEGMGIPEEIVEIINFLEKNERYFSENPEFAKRGEDIIKKAFDLEEIYYPKKEYLKKRMEERPSVGRGGFNVIPNGVPGSCEKVLIVAIGWGQTESVEKRILEAVEHIWAKCWGITKCVIFWAAKWNSSAWLKHAFSFREVDVILKKFYTKPILLWKKGIW